MKNVRLSINIKLLYILLMTGMFSCSKRGCSINEKHVEVAQIEQTENNDLVKSADESGGEDKLISKELFQKWKGKYEYSFQYIDRNGISSDLKANINLIKSDSCVFESWFENPNDEQHNKNEYLRLLGHVYVSDDKNFKIIFLENIVLNGESPSLDPVFTLIKKKNQFYIESFLTSPPHNGIIEMPIEKIR